MAPGSSFFALRGYKRGLGGCGFGPVVQDLSLRRGCPAQNLHMAAGIFDKGAAAFNPVSVVQVEDIADPADFGMMDVTADHAIDAAPGGLVGDDLLEAGNVLGGVLDLVLQPGRQRPVGQAHTLSDRKQKRVGAQHQGIGAVAQMGQPLGIGDDAVETVAVQHQIAPAVGAFMDGFIDDLDAAEQAPGIVAGEFVMVAGHEDHAHAGIHLAQDFGDYMVLRERPVPAALHLPAVHDIADQEQGVAIVMGEEVGKRLGLAAAGAQMGIGDEDGAVAVEAGGVGVGGRCGPVGNEAGEASVCVFEPHGIGHGMPSGLFMTGRLGASHDSFVARTRRSRDGKLKREPGLG